MIFWEHIVPNYLLKRQNIIRTIIFTAIFALAFINFYAPFGVDVWFHVTKVELFFYSSLVILTGILVIVISRIIIYQYSKHREITYLAYSILMLFEVLSMAVFYTLFVKYFLKDERVFFDIFGVTLKNTFLVLFLPYSILWLYFSWREKNEMLEKIELKEAGVPGGKKMLPFHDENGTLRFSILHEDLLYLEASDNYVTIFYSDNNHKISKFLVRNTLKNYENSLKGNNLIRCHRSYIVNFDKVKILKKEKEGLILELNIDQKCNIPISKTYTFNVTNAFGNM